MSVYENSQFIFYLAFCQLIRSWQYFSPYINICTYNIDNLIEEQVDSDCDWRRVVAYWNYLCVVFENVQTQLQIVNGQLSYAINCD